MSFVCAQVQNNVCTEWVQTTFLLPPLSIEDAMRLGSSYLLACATAWGISMVASQFFKR